MSDIEKVRKIIDNRTKIGTMSRDYGHHVDDILHIEDSYELTVIDNAIEELETLRKKETPMKPIINIISGGTCGLNYEQYLCPNCNHGSILIGDYNDKVTHCFNCGQRLDWGDKSE